MEKQLDDNEVNRIIAEFMGYDRLSLSYISTGEYDCVAMDAPYTKSLDALVPVVLKMGNVEDFEDSNTLWFMSMWCQLMKNAKLLFMQNPTYTIQHAAAYVTAKAIKELNE